MGQATTVLSLGRLRVAMKVAKAGHCQTALAMAIKGHTISILHGLRHCQIARALALSRHGHLHSAFTIMLKAMTLATCLPHSSSRRVFHQAMALAAQGTLIQAVRMILHQLQLQFRITSLMDRLLVMVMVIPMM